MAKKTSKNPFSQKLLNELKQALKNFGTYSFDDKGPHEVMDVNSLVREYKILSLAEKMQVSKDLKSNSRSNEVLIAILSELDEKQLPEKDLKKILDVSHEDVKEWFEPSKQGIAIPVMSASDLFNSLGLKTDPKNKK